MSKPVEFGSLPSHTLFTVFAEKRGFYHHGEKRFGLVRSNERRVFKKWGNSHSSTKDGKIIILALKDLVTPYVKR